jgi:hypothetical protein
VIELFPQPWAKLLHSQTKPPAKVRNYAQLGFTSVNFVEKFYYAVDKPYGFVVLCGEFYALTGLCR